MLIEIDQQSGFCFGVVYAIQMAEEQLAEHGELYCLGDIVHNNMEVERLQAKGLKIIDNEQLKDLHNTRVLIRAHGEPPETYRTAIENNIDLIDASCPVVLKLQHRVREGFLDTVADGGQLVIYGKEGHAEVKGLMGQADGKAILVTGLHDLDKIDYTKPIHFFSQTTQSTKGFEEIVNEIRRRLQGNTENFSVQLETNDTLCRQVSNREPQLRRFSEKHDVVVFVAGKKSANGKVLYEICKEVNPRTYFAQDGGELQAEWFDGAQSVGICGATSTPMWLMESVSKAIAELTGQELPA
jgi:4-hydroxy-3-methylbut-2-en-1-yl diphosphate reductase